jgi:hypothetical protein
VENNYNLIDGDGSPKNPEYKNINNNGAVIHINSAIFTHNDINKADKFQKEDMVV